MAVGQTGPPKPILLEFRSSPAFITTVVAVSMFIDILLYGLVVPVTPTALNERASVKPGQEQKWIAIILALYSISLLIFAPISGYITDSVRSRSWPFLAGLVLLAAGTGLLCAGTSIGLWIAGRILQGASTAVIWSAGIALLIDSVNPEHRGQALGYVAATVSAGTLSGPLLGGVIYEFGGYYAVFGTSFALIAVDALLRAMVIERRDAQHYSPSHHGASLSPSSSPSVIQAGPQSSHRNSCCFWKRTPRWLSLLRSASLLCALYGYFAFSLILTAFDTVLPLFVKEVFDWTPASQGLIFLPVTIPQLLGPLTGSLMDKYPRSRRYLATVWFLVSIPALVCMRFVTHNTLPQKVLLCALLGVVGACMAFIAPAFLLEVGRVVEQTQTSSTVQGGSGFGEEEGAVGIAYGMSNTAYGLGMVSGSFLAGFIRDSLGWGTLTWVLAVASAVAFWPTLLFLGGWIGTCG